MTRSNPFVIRSYRCPEWFCDRTTDSGYMVVYDYLFAEYPREI